MGARVTAFLVFPSRQVAMIAHLNSPSGGAFNAALEQVLKTLVLGLPMWTLPVASHAVPALYVHAGPFKASTKRPADAPSLHFEVTGGQPDPARVREGGRRAGSPAVPAGRRRDGGRTG